MMHHTPRRATALIPFAFVLLMASRPLHAQQPAPTAQLGAQANPGSIAGSITDTDHAAIPGAKVLLEAVESKVTRASVSDSTGAFTLPSVPPGQYLLRITFPGFAAWKIKDILILHEAEDLLLPPVELGVESITTTIDAITLEDLAEQQITAEQHQRILGILPNFFVSYVPNAAPLTRRQKFKLAFVISTDPMTFATTGISAGITQAQGGLRGYGPGVSGYAERYAALYGDRLTSTVLGAAVLPSLFHQDPRYFYRGHGRLITRALYAVSTTVICKGDNGRFQPNYSNVFGNLGAAFIARTYAPQTDRHSAQVTVSNAMIGVAYGSFGTLFQEFILRHVTHGAPPLRSLHE